nr:hypothetical protein [Tanacetum cinerariifolium]
MTRSLTNELFTPHKEPGREFRSSSRHFKTLSLDELRSPDFNLLSNQEYSEEEIAETMAETMEQYMSKTRADYGSGVARPKIENKDNFEPKGQFLKELRTNTFSGSDHEDANEHIEKVHEIIDIFHISNITIDQVMLRAFPVSLTGSASRWLRNEPTGASISVMPLLTYLNLGLGELAHTKLTIELADTTICPRISKAPLILVRPFLSTARGKIDVYKRKITLRVREDKVVFTSVKLASSLIKRVYMLSLRERMELDLEARLMGETLVLNRSLDLFFEDYIRLNDLNKPNELKRNQGNDLMPTIEESEVIEEFRTRNEDVDTGIDDYPSYYKMEYKGNNVIETLTNVPIFIGTFSVVTDFTVLENMDAYRDEGMGDVIVGEPFLREAGIKAMRFE